MKKCFTIFLLLISLTVLGQETTFTFNKGEANQSEYFSIIPFESVRGKIIINVSINEKGYRFILDTGGQILYQPDSTMN